MKSLSSVRMFALVMAFAASTLPCTAGAEDTLAYSRDVLPILADKCFRCHGPDEAARQSGLRLDERSAATAPADSGMAAIVPEDPETSELVARITAEDEGLLMPPPDSKQTLSEAEKQTLIRWIQEGAVYEQHWSWEPIIRPSIPAVQNRAWPQNSIDTFILARLEREGLQPSPRADAHRLARRLYLDLTGLPPTPQQVAAFVADSSPAAYERLVDQLLASPAFGERMAWDWLDAARYADSNGYQGDADRTMWPWRDWVVDAWNANLSFDQFTLWQIAGDQLPSATFDQRLATGFSRNHMINGEGGRIPEENRVDYVMDMTETVGTVWLGLTLNCCRCHDHKFDALSRRDYYALFAYFNQTPVDGAGGNPQTPPVLEVVADEQQRQLDSWQQDLVRLAADIEQREGELRAASTTALPEDITAIQAKPLAERSRDEIARLDAHFATTAADYVALLNEHRRIQESRSQLTQSLPRVMVMEDRDELRTTHLLDKGLYNQPGEEVAAAVPTSLPDLPADAPPRRIALAQWLVADDNPLTARVTVNRFWQMFFGTGLVKTSEDFGTQGERPSHPELLDWLATELRSQGWDTKALCRLIVTSQTYQQSSEVTPELLEHDPANRLLARAPRYRLPAWMIRDQALAVSGLLVSDIGGAPVFPYQPEGVWEEATFGNRTYATDKGAKLYRRSLYTFWRRIVGPTMFFDSATRQTCVVKQARTNTPLHALTTLNDTTYLEAARVLAERLVATLPAGSTPQDRAAALFERILCRPPTADELSVLEASLTRLEQQFAAAPEQCDKFLSVGQQPRREGLEPTQVAALAALAGGLMNLDETLSKE